MQTFQVSHLTKTNSELIKRFIKDVGLPFNLAPEALGIKPSEFMQWMAGHDVFIDRHQLTSLSQYLSLNEDCIVDGTYDKNLVRKRLFESSEALPEKYSQNQYSYVRSSAHIIKYLTLTRGQHFSDQLLRSLNISPLIYSNIDNKISINYFVDLLDALAKTDLSQTEIDSLAGMLFLGIEGTALGDKFKKARNYFECYEVLAQNIAMFDSNFEYAFELEKDKVLIRSKFQFDKHFQEKWSLEKIMRLERYRHLLSGWYPFLSKLAPVVPKHSVQAFPNRIEASYLIKFDEIPSTKPVGLQAGSTLHFL